ncbi:MAG: efflux RND transporter periplasmic adaptor subunit [Armatimonadota bacterium]|nr:efflux RND transporter periplasmic adaptor subunit [Armatimonadota bacterium]
MKRRIILITGIVAIVLVAIVAVRGQLLNRREAPKFRTFAVTRGDLQISVSATGTVEPVSIVDVRSRATGIVRAVFVEEGTRVEKGQVLVEIDDPDARSALENALAELSAARARLAQAEATLALQRASVETAIKQAEANLAAARARLAQALAAPQPEDVAQAEEQVRQAEAAVDLAKQNLSRQEQLFASGFISQAQLDQARNQFEVAQAQLRAAQARLAQVKAGTQKYDLEVLRAQVRQAEAQLAEAQNGMLQVQLREQEVAAARAQVQSAEASVRQTRERLGETRILAPITGIVAKRSVEIGQSVIGGTSGGTPVITLADVSMTLAKVYVDETDIARIPRTAQVEITADALPGMKFTGRILRIAPQPVVQQNVTQYPVLVRIEDPENRLKLGMTVDAEFIVARRSNVLLVPQEAVRGENRKVVMVVQEGKLTPRPVRTGISDGRFVEILSGLREGESVYLGPARSSSSPTARPTSPFQPQFRPRR